LKKKLEEEKQKRILDFRSDKVEEEEEREQKRAKQI